jgi:hypothetical protein
LRDRPGYSRDGGCNCPDCMRGRANVRQAAETVEPPEAAPPSLARPEPIRPAPMTVPAPTMEWWTDPSLAEDEDEDDESARSTSLDMSAAVSFAEAYAAASRPPNVQTSAREYRPLRMNARWTPSEVVQSEDRVRREVGRPGRNE